MRKLLVGLSLLASISSFAGDSSYDEFKENVISRVSMFKNKSSRLVKYYNKDRIVCYAAGEILVHELEASLKLLAEGAKRIFDLDLLSKKILADSKAGKIDPEKALEQQQSVASEEKKINSLYEVLAKVQYTTRMSSDFCLETSDTTVQDVKDEASANVAAAQAILDVIEGKE